MKRTAKFRGGQRVLHTHRLLSDRQIRQMIIDSHRIGQDAAQTISDMGGKNTKSARELYTECTVLADVLTA